MLPKHELAIVALMRSLDPFLAGFTDEQVIEAGLRWYSKNQTTTAINLDELHEELRNEGTKNA